MTVTLPPHFTLSASSLKLLDQCPRLFRFVYGEHLIWPVAEAITPTDDAERGKLFHRLVELHSRGRSIDPALLAALDPVMRGWWQTFLASPHAHPRGTVYSELPLWTRIGGMNVMAVLDRLVWQGETAQIVDWKTDQIRPPDRRLAESWQVRLYPLLVCRVGIRSHPPIDPDRLEMTIWYVNDPDRPYHRRYSRRQWEQDQQYLLDRLERIPLLAQQNFPRTSHTQICSGCGFRRRCYGLPPEEEDWQAWGILEEEGLGIHPPSVELDF
ncbi:MAG: PD-(D/E)XK nuclease family protein [Cyanobacteriota bacterium]|nr:PD-(D/E)XK nuclease family protein [Cyanobacteriota bacterium]